MNYFIEGLQGSGKSTMVDKVAKKYPGCTVFREGDYSPVDLAWCAYVSEEEYQSITDKYRDICTLIEEKSHTENDHRIICYTQVITDISGFHKDLEQYEIYNGRRSLSEFKEIVFSRYKRWNGKNMIFECALFQNIIEDMILYRNASDQEIMEFYSELEEVIRDRNFRILYLETDDIEDNIQVIRKERSDDNGNEMWFPLMLAFFDTSPYAIKRGISGEEELLKHFAHRQELELRICNEFFSDRLVLLRSKSLFSFSLEKKCDKIPIIEMTFE